MNATNPFLYKPKILLSLPRTSTRVYTIIILIKIIIIIVVVVVTGETIQTIKRGSRVQSNKNTRVCVCVWFSYDFPLTRRCICIIPSKSLCVHVWLGVRMCASVYAFFDLLRFDLLGVNLLGMGTTRDTSSRAHLVATTTPLERHARPSRGSRIRVHRVETERRRIHAGA